MRCCEYARPRLRLAAVRLTLKRKSHDYSVSQRSVEGVPDAKLNFAQVSLPIANAPVLDYKRSEEAECLPSLKAEKSKRKIFFVIDSHIPACRQHLGYNRF